MVGKALSYAAIFAAFPALVLAQSPRDQMFPSDTICYARSYTASHLAEHPAQRVTDIQLVVDRSGIAKPLLGLSVRVSLRGVPGGQFEALAVCENNGGSTLYCAMEGDAGGFTVKPAQSGSVLVQVSSYGMSFENDRGFEMLERDAGDDRSFLLHPAKGCR